MELGRGINLENMFEAPTESTWGNLFSDEYIEQIAELAFDHTRVSDTLGACRTQHAELPHLIQSSFLKIKFERSTRCIHATIYTVALIH